MSNQNRPIEHFTEAKDQFLYGSRLLYGNPSDEAEAASWFAKSADQGHAEAQGSLGSLYLHGKGVPQDDSLAEYWIRKAAVQGDRNSQRLLGFLYTEGRGVPQDYMMALHWFKQSADRGDSFAQKILEAMVNAKGDPQSFGQILDAANNGEIHAQRSLGDFYKYGKGVPGASEQSAKWFRMASDQDDAYSQKLLGEFFRDGKGVSKDNIQAYDLFRKAADQGDSSAQKEAGLLYCDDKAQSAVGNTPLLQNEFLLREYLNDDTHQFDRYSKGQLCDALGTILYDQELYDEAAHYYFQAYDDGYYKDKVGSIGLVNLARMKSSGILSASSPHSKSQQRFNALDAIRADSIERSNNAAIMVAAATFVGYHLLIYVTKTTGTMHDESLLIAGGLSWIAWWLTLKSFEGS